MGYSSYIAYQCKSDATFCSEVVFAHEMYTRVMYIQYVPGMLQIIHHTYIICYNALMLMHYCIRHVVSSHYTSMTRIYIPCNQ